MGHFVSSQDCDAAICSHNLAIAGNIEDLQECPDNCKKILESCKVELIEPNTQAEACSLQTVDVSCMDFFTGRARPEDFTLWFLCVPSNIPAPIERDLLQGAVKKVLGNKRFGTVIPVVAPPFFVSCLNEISASSGGYYLLCDGYLGRSRFENAIGNRSGANLVTISKSPLKNNGKNQINLPGGFSDKELLLMRGLISTVFEKTVLDSSIEFGNTFARISVEIWNRLKCAFHESYKGYLMDSISRALNDDCPSAALVYLALSSLGTSDVDKHAFHLRRYFEMFHPLNFGHVSMLGDLIRFEENGSFRFFHSSIAYRVLSWLLFRRRKLRTNQKVTFLDVFHDWCDTSHSKHETYSRWPQIDELQMRCAIWNLFLVLCPWSMILNSFEREGSPLRTLIFHHDKNPSPYFAKGNGILNPENQIWLAKNMWKYVRKAVFFDGCSNVAAVLIDVEQYEYALQEVFPSENDLDLRENFTLASTSSVLGCYCDSIHTMSGKRKI